jgi:hypothetical protein
MCEAKKNPDECLRYLSFWLNSCYSHVTNKQDCDILLVGTHRDVVGTMAEHRTISDELGKAFKSCSFWKCVRKPLFRDLCFFPVDNTGTVDTTGVAAVMSTINLLAEEQVNAREEKPLRWLKVLDELQQLGDTTNYINMESRKQGTPREPDSTQESRPDLWGIAKGHGVADPDDFDALVTFFDAIGIFKRCGDVVILRPQWLVNVFSAIISCCHQEQDGEQYQTPSSPSALSHDLYRFDSKAILSVRLLWHLWEQKGVIEANSTHLTTEDWKKMSPKQRVTFVSREHQKKQEERKDSFELLVDLLLRFDLMFELKTPDTGDTGNAEDDISDGDSASVSGRRRFLVPAMLGDTDEFSPWRSLAQETSQPPLHCYFTFKEEGAEGTSTANGHRGGLLPAVVFTKLQAKCACWAQSTSNTEPRLSRNHAEVTFGAQRFELRLVQENCTIVAILRAYSHPESVISLLQRIMLDVILAESFPSLVYETNVQDAKSSRYRLNFIMYRCPLSFVVLHGIVSLCSRYLPLERVQLELATQKELNGNSSNLRKTFKFRGCLYDCAQFDAWLSTNDDEGSMSPSDIATADGSYDIFICAHERDLEFVCRLKDCLERRTNGRIQLKCSSRVMLWSPGRMQQGMLGQHRNIRQDLFSISRSILFVPIISAATLEQWSFEKRVPKR